MLTKGYLHLDASPWKGNYGGNGDVDDEDDNKDDDEGDNDGDDDDGGDVSYNRLFFEGGEKATGLCFNNIQIYSFSKEK